MALTSTRAAHIGSDGESTKGRPLDGKSIACAFVGLMCLWPFVSFSSRVSLWTSAAVGETNALVGGHAVALYSTMLAVCFVVLGLLSLRPNDSVVNVWIPSVAFGLIGSVGVALLSSAPENPVVLVVGLGGIAVFVSTSVLAWGSWTTGARLVARIGILLSAAAVSCVVSLACHLLDIDFQGVYAVSPLISFLLFGLLTKKQAQPREIPVPADDSSNEAPSFAQRFQNELAAFWDLPLPIIVFASCLLALTSVIVAVLVGHQPDSLSVGAHLFIAAATVTGALLIMGFTRLRLKTLDDLYVLFGLFVVFYGTVLALMFLMPVFGGASLSLRLCLVMFLWVVFAVSCAWAPFFPPLGFSLFGLFAIAPMGMRLFDYESALEALHRNSLFGPVAAGFVFLTLCGIAFAIVRAHMHGRSAIEKTGDAPSLGDSAPDAIPGEFARRMENAVLTEREREVALLAVKGYTAKRIAEELVVSEYTAKNHLSSIYRKMGVVSKQELIKLWEVSR